MIQERIEEAKDEVIRKATERESQYISRINGQLSEIERLNRCRDSDKANFELELLETRWPTKKLSEVEIRKSKLIKMTDLSAHKVIEFPQEDHYKLRQLQPFSFVCNHYTIAAQFGQSPKQTIGFDDINCDHASEFKIDQINAERRVAKIGFQRFKCGGCPFLELKFLSRDGTLLGRVANWSEKDVDEWINDRGRAKADEETGSIDLEPDEIIAGIRAGRHKNGWLVFFQFCLSKMPR